MRVALGTAAIAVSGLSMLGAPTASAIPGYVTCPSPFGVTYEINGGVTCADTWVVQDYNWDSGPKFQEIADFTCYTSSADQKPVLLSCVSERGELIVSEV